MKTNPLRANDGSIRLFSLPRRQNNGYIRQRYLVFHQAHTHKRLCAISRHITDIIVNLRIFTK